jgi:DHA1 family tetracycline resistance protein-like MFS transporter
MKRKAAVPFIMLTSLLDVIGIGLIIPVLPLLVGEFTPSRDAQVVWFNALIICFGLAQFFCAPLLGALSDRYGRRPILLLGIGGLGLTFLVTALTQSLWVLAGIRLLGGALSANFAVAQAYVADITTTEKRTPALGMLGAMFGLGFVLGPVIGGVLGDINLRLPLYVAAGLCGLNWLYGLLVLPESLPPEQRTPVRFGQLNPFSALAGLTRLRGVGPLVFAIAAASLAKLTLQSSWVLYTSFRFQWGPLQNGMSLFAVGLVAVVVQGGLLKMLLRRMGERRLVATGLASGAVAYALYGLVPDGWMLYVVIVANALAFASPTALQGIVSKAADPREQGRAMASLTSLISITGIAAPLLASLLLAPVSHLPPDHILVGAPFFACALLEAFACLVALRYFSRNPAPADAAALGNAA